MIVRYQQTICSILLWLCAAVAISGCGSRESVSKSNSGFPASKSVKQSNGPVELTVRIEPDEIQLSEEAVLTLSVRKPLKMRIDFPNLAGQLDDFTIAGTRDSLPTMDGELQIVQRIYQLQPKRAGAVSLVLPPVYFGLEGQDTEKQFVEVDPIELQVLSQTSAEDPSLSDLRQASGPLDLPPPKTNTAVWIALGVVAIGVATMMALLLLSSKKQHESIKLTPRELALSELQQLIDSQLAQTDRKLHYVQLTAIVRRYIEGTTSIRAPELTTEEFLREISSAENFPTGLKLSLKAFLESADLVKFAGQNPTEQDLTSSVQRAREFIDSQWHAGGASP